MALVASAIGALVGIAGADPPAPTFEPKRDFVTGDAPASVVVGDLSGDGLPDIALAESGSPGGVSVRLGNGTGGLQPKVTFASGRPTSSVAIGDMNGDDVPDLVAGRSDGAEETLYVLLGTGGGWFAQGEELSVGPNPFSVVLSDLNGDDHLDVVVGSVDYTGFSPGGVGVLLGDGAGGLEQGAGYGAGQLPSSIALADLNGDGRLDMVTTDFLSTLDLDNPDPPGVSVRLGNGAGGFGSATDYLASIAYPTSVALADLNSDGKVDLAFVNAELDGGGAVRLGDGAGGFGAEIPFDTGSNPRSVAGGDVTRDGLADLVVTNSGSNTVSVLRGDGSGDFGVRTDVMTGTRPVSAAIADLNGAGGPDLVVANYDSNTVSVLLNTSPTLPAAPTILRNATAGNAQATVSWTPPASNGGSPITGYVVTPFVGYYPLPSVAFASTATAQTLAGLTNGTTYRFKVAALNAVGTGPKSKVTNPVTPAQTAPNAPTIGSATPGSGEATVSWTPPVSDGGAAITGYVVTPYIGYFPLAPTVFASTATVQTITGLANGTTYRFRVRAINAVGTGAYSKVTNPATPTA
ncbi:MAG: FG-GAP-like repeat-containing protein [Actinomycetota bacterium]